MLLVETSREFGRDFLYGVAKYSRLHGPWSFYMEPRGLDSSLPHLMNWQIDGIILRDPKKFGKLISLGVPTIFVLHYDTDKPDFPSVITHGEQISRLAAQHFLDHGFRYFAYCGFDDLYWSNERGDCFSHTIDQAGYQTHYYRQPKSRSLRIWEREQVVLVEWLQSLPKPVAVMACNDDRGKHITEACKTAGLRVPDDVAIIGVDNDILVCDFSDPPLSSIALNVEKAGYEAARLLDGLMAGDKMAGQKIMVDPTHIVTRQSTDIIAIEDPDIVKAIRFIRNNAQKPIQVSDVADAAALSRRILEKRFRKILNRSVYKEIRKSRVNRCIQMLVETNLSISEIAQSMGSGIEHISRYFRQETGMSLSAYRKAKRTN